MGAYDLDKGYPHPRCCIVHAPVQCACTELKSCGVVLGDPRVVA